MRTVTSASGSIVIDSYPLSLSATSDQIRAIRAAGVDAVAGYLGVMSKTTVQAVLAAGMGFLPVTLAGEYEDGAQDELSQLKDLGLVGHGLTVFMDMEGLKAYKTAPAQLIAKLDAWADAILRAGYTPGLYVGNPQPLTSEELWKLKVQRYWKGQGRCVDRNNDLAEPACGWCLVQAWPSVKRAGALVDINMVTNDYKGRTPAWAAQ